MPRATPKTLQQFAVMAGYMKQVDVLRACEARGFPLPQTTLSSMYRGNLEYPKARESLLRLFWPEEWARTPEIVERRLARLITSSAAVSNGR
jgi:hypothetical protein